MYLIDLLGMGRSTRNNFECDNYDECEKYFVNAIEKWRIHSGINTSVRTFNCLFK